MYPIWTLTNSAFDVAADWGLTDQSSFPIKIACVPALCTDPGNFAYRQDYVELDWSQFDLVLISDIEMFTQQRIKEWATGLGIQRYLVAVGSLYYQEDIADNAVYRPWWCYNLLRHNQPQTVDCSHEFKFNALLGARRPHRDYIATWMQQNLPENLLTYRDFFQGAVINCTVSESVAEEFAQPLQFPYVSPHLNPAWEVQENLDYKISSIVPWEIYRHSSYSIVCETLGVGDCFFMSEKTTKALYAQQVFVVVSNKDFYKRLHQLGFRTFGHIIDESWDSEPVDIKRYRRIVQAINQLNELDPSWVYNQAAEVLAHNRQHLQTLQQQTGQRISDLIHREVASVLATK